MDGLKSEPFISRLPIVWHFSYSIYLIKIYTYVQKIFQKQYKDLFKNHIDMVYISINDALCNG